MLSYTPRDDGPGARVKNQYVLETFRRVWRACSFLTLPLTSLPHTDQNGHPGYGRPSESGIRACNHTYSNPFKRCVSRVFKFSIALFGGVAEAAFFCAHRTSTVSPCAFCEQEGHLAAPPLPPSSLVFFFSGWPGLALNCARRARPFRARAPGAKRATRLPPTSIPLRPFPLQTLRSFHRSRPGRFPNTHFFGSVCRDVEGRDG